MTKKYIFADIDKTIFYDGDIPGTTIEALRKAKANGHAIYMCTGRPINRIPPPIYDIIDFDGKICSSGTYIEIDHKVYLDYFFPVEMLEQLVSIYIKHNVVYTLETNKDFHYGNIDENIYKIFFDPKTNKEKMMKDPLNYLPPVFFKYGDPWPEVNKMCIFSSDGADLVTAVCEELPDEYIFYTQPMHVRSWWYCEVSPRNISKGSAINYLVKNHQIPFKDTVAIGDSMNDEEMIRYAEIGIAMGNSDERLKEIADFVTTDFYDDGLAKAFNYLGVI